MKVVDFAKVFNAKVINNEGERDRSPLVKPETRCGGSLVVSGFVEAFGKDFIG